MLRWMKDNWKVVKKVISHHTGKILFLIVIELVSMALAVAIPMLNMELINLFAYEKWSSKHICYLLGYIVFLVFMALLGYWGSVLKRTIDLQMEEELKRKVFEKAFCKSQRDYDVNELGELDASIKMDVSIFQQFVMKYLLEFPFVSLRLLCVGVILCVQCFEIAIVMGMVQLLVVMVRRMTTKRLEDHSIAVRMEFAKLNEIIGDVVGKISYIAPLGAKQYTFQRFHEFYGRYISRSIELAKTGTGISLLIEFLMNLNLVAILGIGSLKIYKGELSVGALLSIIQYMGLFLGAFSSLTTYLVEMHSESRNINNILLVLSGEQVDETNHIVLETILKIVVENASFSYPSGKGILAEANAEFELGKLNCVMGPSGAGKSTLLKLLLGKYPLEKGEISLFADGERKRLSQDQISFVPQENVFFTDTIYNNIVLGKELDKECVYEVCKECSIYEDILKLEDGFDTVISNGISNFSGGQIKRLSIARAIVQNKAILLVDEPTVGLDKENVKKVVECIAKYAKEKIVIVITHDKEIEKKAEKVYSLVDKKLVRQ